MFPMSPLQSWAVIVALVLLSVALFFIAVFAGAEDDDT